MFKDLFLDFLRRYWWGILVVVILIIGGIWWYQDSQKVEVSGYKISQEAAQAVKYYANGEIGKAEAQYKSIVENHPRDWFSWNGLGNIYRDKSEYESAEIAYLKALDINPKFEQAYRNIYSLYYIWSKDNPDKIYQAEDILLQGVKYLPNSEIVLEEILNYYQKIDNQEQFKIFQGKLDKLRNLRPANNQDTLEFN
ncbi:tetratricopeptide repeat protein [Patescibacteria group bacterium]|nr:tetratricopeptide repeat protein [Patescibacteria group bacterium]